MPLHEAVAEGGKVQIVELLIGLSDCEAHVNHEDHEGNTPLHLACGGGNHKVWVGTRGSHVPRVGHTRSVGDTEVT